MVDDCIIPAGGEWSGVVPAGQVLRAETDALVAMSNCPQIHNRCNGGRPSPIRLVTYESAEGAAVTRAETRASS